MKKLLSIFLLTSFCFILSSCSYQSNSDSNVEMRTVTDERGEVEIPVEPKRIVDLSGNSDILALLDLPVVGTANSDAYDYTKLPSYLEDVLKDAKILGYSYQDTMDIENIINVEPDLIVISTIQEKMYETLSAVAPTIMIQLDDLNWKANIDKMASLFQKENEAEAWINAYETKANEVSQSVKEKMGDSTFYLSFLASGGQFFIFSGAGFGDVLYSDLNLEVPTGLPQQANVSLPVVTIEGLVEIDADVIFVIATEADRLELEQSSIWNSLPAVEANKVIYLPSSPYFNQGYSPIGRQLLLNEIEVFIDELQGE